MCIGRVGGAAHHILGYQQANPQDSQDAETLGCDLHRYFNTAESEARTHTAVDRDDARGFCYDSGVFLLLTFERIQ